LGVSIYNGKGKVFKPELDAGRGQRGVCLEDQVSTKFAKRPLRKKKSKIQRMRTYKLGGAGVWEAPQEKDKKKATWGATCAVCGTRCGIQRERGGKRGLLI